MTTQKIEKIIEIAAALAAIVSAAIMLQQAIRANETLQVNTIQPCTQSPP